MVKILLIILLVCGHMTFAQNTNPTKNHLLRWFKASIEQDHSGKIGTNSNPWVICNKDSSFHKSDTLKLYNNKNYYYYSQCCDFTNWTFYKKNDFVLTKVKICDEPATGSIARNEDWFIIKVSKKKKSIFLETYNQGQLIEKFKVLSLAKVDNIGQPREITSVIILLRITNHYVAKSLITFAILASLVKT
jgi:hypothetical protein